MVPSEVAPVSTGVVPSLVIGASLVASSPVVASSGAVANTE
jgi:hypothetical protein